MSPQTTNQYSYVTNNPLTFDIRDSSSSALALRAGSGGFLGAALPLYFIGAYTHPLRLGEDMMYGYKFDGFWKVKDPKTGMAHVKFLQTKGGEWRLKAGYGSHKG